jgi:hypothetical protein
MSPLDVVVQDEKKRRWRGRRGTGQGGLGQRKKEEGKQAAGMELMAAGLPGEERGRKRGDGPEREGGLDRIGVLGVGVFFLSFSVFV